MVVKSADEFYCAMGQLSQEMLLFSITDSNRLIKVINIVNNVLKLRALLWPLFDLVSCAAITPINTQKARNCFVPRPFDNGNTSKCQFKVFLDCTTTCDKKLH